MCLAHLVRVLQNLVDVSDWPLFHSHSYLITHQDVRYLGRRNGGTCHHILGEETNVANALPLSKCHELKLTAGRYLIAIAPAAVIFSVAAHARGFLPVIPIIGTSTLLLALHGLPRMYPGLMGSHHDGLRKGRRFTISHTSGPQRSPTTSVDGDSSGTPPEMLARFLKEDLCCIGTHSPLGQPQVPSIGGSDIDLTTHLAYTNVALRRSHGMQGLERELVFAGTGRDFSELGFQSPRMPMDINDYSRLPGRDGYDSSLENTSTKSGHSKLSETKNTPD